MIPVLVQDGAMDALQERLRAAGLRVTGPRLAVLAHLSEGGHHSADSLTEAVRRRVGTVSTQAVYDVLRALVGAGLVRPVEVPGRARFYEARTAEGHHHAVCRRCGAVADVEAATPAPRPTGHSGYVLDDAVITYWGTCLACQPKPDPAQPARPQEATA